ncbi:hypothetical protein EI94DRAFT_1702692 [Lactarius quietus]|nr:hypothetical protein EI94DRAFT_1702692 [Lactarius quietus]
MSSHTIKCCGCRTSRVQAHLQSPANAPPVPLLAPNAETNDALATSVPTDDDDRHSDSIFGSPFATPPVCDSPLPLNPRKHPEMEAADSNISSAPPLDHASDLPVQCDTGNSEPDWKHTVVPFPHGQPGAPLVSTPRGTTIYDLTRDLLGESVWAPFQSQCDWELAYWAKTRGPTASALTDLLAIPALVEALGLSYHTSRELNRIIDNNLPGTPTFKVKEFSIGGELLEFHYRDIILCIQSLMSNPEFALGLIFAPERHYTDGSRTSRIYNEMHTGNWWWSVQMALESRQPGATVIPLIISSDKTMLTAFQGTTAYPIYMGIGNIPKDIR